MSLVRSSNATTDRASAFATEYTGFSLRAVLAPVVATLRERVAAGVELRCVVHDEVPDHTFGDPLGLRGLLWRLIADAVRSTHRGEIEVEVYLLNNGDGDLELQALVTDTRSSTDAPVLDDAGLSIPPALAPGCASELSTVPIRDLAEALGASILIHISPGEGTIAHVDFPLGRPRAALNAA